MGEDYREMMEAQRQILEEMRQSSTQLRLTVDEANHETQLILEAVRATMAEVQGLVNEMMQKLSAKK